MTKNHEGDKDNHYNDNDNGPCLDGNGSVVMCEDCEREYFENADPCQYYLEGKKESGDETNIYHMCALYQDARTCPLKATMCKVKTLQLIMENLDKL